MTAPDPNDRVELLAIRLAGKDFAFELSTVKEVIRLPDLVNVPDLPAFVAGVINFRGVALPVIDLRSRFEDAGAASTPGGKGARIPAQRLVICAVKFEAGVADKVVAFQVDGASQIVRVPRGTILPAGEGDVRTRNAVVGIVPDGSRRLTWLDPAGLLSSDEKLSLDRFRMRKEDWSASR